MFFSSEVFVRILFRSLIFVLARQIIDSSYRKENLVDGHGKGELVYEKEGHLVVLIVIFQTFLFYLHFQIKVKLLRKSRSHNRGRRP